MGRVVLVRALEVGDQGFGSAIGVVSLNALEHFDVLVQRGFLGARSAHGLVMELLQPLQHGLRDRFVNRIARDFGDAAVKGHVGDQKALRIFQ